MHVSDDGRKMVERFEGLYLSAYRDIVGVLTIGYGHTSRSGPPTVTPGMRITEQDADSILAYDLRKFELGVDQNVSVPLLQCEFDSLVSLAFNIGLGAFKTSTLLRDINRGNKRAAADRFLDWNRAGGRVIAGLTKRRAIERAHFLGAGQPAMLVANISADDQAHAIDHADGYFAQFANYVEHHVTV